MKKNLSILKILGIFVLFFGVSSMSLHALDQEKFNYWQKEENIQRFLKAQSNVLAHLESIKLETSSLDIVVPEAKTLNVPFSSQAPLGNWVPPFDEACEETSLLMVEYFYRGESLNSENANQKIKDLTGFVEGMGMIIDIGVGDVAFVAKSYFGRDSEIYYDQEVTVQLIESKIAEDLPVIVPVAGRVLDNPYYIQPGPPYHMVVVVGYDQENFIIHDPGTGRGANQKFEKGHFVNSIHDWAGSKQNVLEGRKAVMVIKSE